MLQSVEELEAQLDAGPSLVGQGWREVASFEDLSDEDEYSSDEEEIYAVLDLGGSIDRQTFQTESTYQLIGIETALPFLKLGNQVYQGEVTPLIGDEVILGTVRNPLDPTKPSHPPLHSTSHRITFRPIAIRPRTDAGALEDEDPTVADGALAGAGVGPGDPGDMVRSASQSSGAGTPSGEKFRDMFVNIHAGKPLVYEGFEKDGRPKRNHHKGMSHVGRVNVVDGRKVRGKSSGEGKGKAAAKGRGKGKGKGKEADTLEGEEDDAVAEGVEEESDMAEEDIAEDEPEQGEVEEHDGAVDPTTDIGGIAGIGQSMMGTDHSMAPDNPPGFQVGTTRADVDVDMEATPPDDFMAVDGADGPSAIPPEDVSDMILLPEASAPLSGAAVAPLHPAAEDDAASVKGQIEQAVAPATTQTEPSLMVVNVPHPGEQSVSTTTTSTFLAPGLSEASASAPPAPPTLALPSTSALPSAPAPLSTGTAPSLAPPSPPAWARAPAAAAVEDDFLSNPMPLLHVGRWKSKPASGSGDAGPSAPPRKVGRPRGRAVPRPKITLQSEANLKFLDWAALPDNVIIEIATPSTMGGEPTITKLNKSQADRINRGLPRWGSGAKAKGGNIRARQAGRREREHEEAATAATAATAGAGSLGEDDQYEQEEEEGEDEQDEQDEQDEEEDGVSGDAPTAGASAGGDPATAAPSELSLVPHSDPPPDAIGPSATPSARAEGKAKAKQPRTARIARITKPPSTGPATPASLPPARNAPTGMVFVKKDNTGAPAPRRKLGSVSQLRSPAPAPIEGQSAQVSTNTASGWAGGTPQATSSESQPTAQAQPLTQLPRPGSSSPSRRFWSSSLPSPGPSPAPPPVSAPASSPAGPAAPLASAPAAQPAHPTGAIPPTSVSILARALRGAAPQPQQGPSGSPGLPPPP